MAKRQEILEHILSDKYEILSSILPIMTMEDLIQNDLYDEVNRVYKQLNGELDPSPLRFGSFDIVTPCFIVELDEEQHFNRYRRITLDSWIYELGSWFDVRRYNLYCRVWQTNYLRKASHSKHWTSNSTEKQFGEPVEPGIINGHGSPRWKQRAFYDFLRDVYSQVYEIPVIRISIYDIFVNEGFVSKLDEIISSRKQEFYPQIITFIQDLIYPEE